MNKVEEIGDRAFQNCKNLRDGGISWSEKLSVIGNYAFQGCGFSKLNMSEVNFNGNNTVTIGEGAFAYCTAMISVTLPGNVKNISKRMFYNCSSLINIYFTEETETIEEEAFANCTALKEVSVPVNVMKIKTRAFNNCTSLTGIIINQKNTDSEEFFIAENAFPIKNNVTMKGYGEVIQEYAEKKGYSFETLSSKYTVYQAGGLKNYASLVINANPAVAGTEIVFTITPKEGYCLREGTITGRGSSPVEPQLLSCTDKQQTFGFTMPAADVTIDAEFDKISNVSSDQLKYELNKVNNQPVDVDYSNNLVTMQKTGQEAQLVVYGAQTIGSWLLNYKSSNEAVARISDTGIICAVGKGNAVITASLHSDASRKVSFKVVVLENAEIDNIEIDLGKPNRARLKTVLIGNEEYQVVEYNKATLAAGNQSFKVSLKTTDSNFASSNLIVDSVWETIDKQIASVASATSNNNSNVVTVKKGAEGETTVTVKVANKDEDKTVCQKSFIIRVVDATPRLANSSITVNSLSDVGASIDIIPVYGYEIDHDAELQLCQKTVTDGVVSYDDVYEGLTIEYDNMSEEYRLLTTKALELEPGKSISFKGKTQLYIKGEFETGGTFIIPVSQITITNKNLNPTVKLTGKINLFYNSAADDSQKGTVAISQNLTNEVVTKYELVSDANNKKAGTEPQDTFAANFEIDGDGIVRRSDSPMMQVNNKDVTAGWLYIYYEGYDEPVKKKITIPTCNTAPNYVLSMSSAVASVYKKNQAYQIELLDKKNKQYKVDLEDLDNEAGLSFDYSNSGTTRELFKDLDIEAAKSKNCIELNVDGTPFKGKAVINVKMSTWSKPVKYTFVLNVTTKTPSLKLSASRVTLNNLCMSQNAVIEGTLNQADPILKGYDESTLVFTGSKARKEEADKIRITFAEAKITVSLCEEVKAGEYSFKVRPIVQYEENGNEYPLNYVTFRVRVNGEDPKVSLKKSTFSLNALYPGIEEAANTYTISNLPDNSSYSIDSRGVQITATNAKNLAAQDMADNIDMSFEQSGVIKVKLKEDGLYTGNFNYEYYVNGLKIQMAGEPEAIELKPFKIRIKGTKATPVIKVATKGILNPVNTESEITCTAKVTNIVSEIEKVTIQELNLEDNRNDYYRDENGKPTSEHFTLEWKGNTAVIKAKEGRNLKAGTSYKIQLVYKLEAVSGKEYATGDIVIRPRQTLPKIKADRSSAYIYAGQNRAKEIKIKLNKTSQPGAEIEDVGFAKGTSDAIKAAYRITYDQKSDTMTLTLLNPALIVSNKKQTLAFETKCVGQMENSTGTIFKLDVTVYK